MNVMPYIRELEAVGFAENVLDRAIAAAGANHMLYQTLCRAVEEKGYAPTEALDLAETGGLLDI